MNADTAILNQPLTLPCGAVIKNRIMKSAMSEIMGDKGHGPTPALFRLYERWARGGTGLLLTGNVMVDRRALGEPRNVVLEDDRHLDGLRRWAESATIGGTHAWVQLNHPGRQSPAFLSPEPVAPSAIPYTSDLRHVFNPPRELSDGDIRDIIARFARAAGLSRQAGFTGVQIHGAHGYLVSQFLSPRFNRRTDDWGGSIENRMRFLLEIIRAVRIEVGADFPVSVKLNSSDFRNRGFSEDDALVVIRALSAEGVDLIEISGGTYEAPAMMGGAKSAKDARPFFIDFAEKAVAAVDTPIALTGGFRNASTMADAMTHANIAMVGIGRPLVVDPELSEKVLAGEPWESTVRPLTTGLAFLDRVTMLEITWYENQMRYLGEGRDPRPRENVYLTVFRILKNMGAMAFKRRRA
ncbi:NADH:flavin oxidoreductase/NADH oxidase family protein [Desulfatiferula olefinivorans]